VPDAQFTVPYPEHSHFVGREDDLIRLHAALQGEGQDAVGGGLCVSVSGALS